MFEADGNVESLMAASGRLGVGPWMVASVVVVVSQEQKRIRIVGAMAGVRTGMVGGWGRQW